MEARLAGGEGCTVVQMDSASPLGSSEVGGNPSALSQVGHLHLDQSLDVPRKQRRPWVRTLSR